MGWRSVIHCRQVIAGDHREGRVGRLMRVNAISVIRTRKFKITTDGAHSFNIAPNLLKQDFSASRPDQKRPLSDASISCRVIDQRYQLYPDPRGMAPPRGYPGPAFAARDPLSWFASNPLPGGGQPVLLARLPETAAPAWVQRVHERQRKLLPLSAMQASPAGQRTTPSSRPSSNPSRPS